MIYFSHIETDPSTESYKLDSFIEESNSTPGYIKELCYNNNGRLICSPYGYGVRLMSTVNNYEDKTPKQLKEMKYITSHKNTVLTTRFSPHLTLLASGCLDGQVVFYHPQL